MAQDNVVHLQRTRLKEQSRAETVNTPVEEYFTHPVDYSDALRLMKQGSVMRREEWEAGVYVKLRASFAKREMSYLEEVSPRGCIPYTPSQLDQFSHDWVDTNDKTREGH